MVERQFCKLRVAGSTPVLSYFFLGIFAPDFRAVFNAMATACFWGLPAAISVLMFALIAFFDLPFFSGICLSF